MAQSVIRRYTPPTCTLEISGNKYPFRKNTGLNRLKELSFALRFDDPRLPEEKQVSIEGDRSQLDLLCDAVNPYVHDFLAQPYHNLNLGNSLVSPPTTPALQLRGLLNHELFFGSLATENSGPGIKLSASQLFDLANALNEYQQDALLPVNAPTRPYIFLGITAASLLLTVGLTPVIVDILQKETTSEKKAPVVYLEKPELPKETTPTPTVGPQPTPTPVPTPTLPPTLAQEKRLAPPLRVEIPPPPIPTPAPPLIPPPPPPISQGEIINIKPNSASVPPSPPPIIQFEDPDVNPNLPQIPSFEIDSNINNNDSPLNNFEQAEDLPQLEEVRNYFEQRWQPPEMLTQSLQYSLVLNNNGSIGRIIPLGEAAKLYLDRTGMPLMGDSFVSPISEPGKPTIRLVLTPDGQVQTFLEKSR